MNPAIAQIAALLRKGQRMLVVGGNVDDLVLFGKNGSHNRFLSFLAAMTAQLWPNMAVYDGFNGSVVIRGDTAFRSGLDPTAAASKENLARSEARSGDALAAAVQRAASKFAEETATSQRSSNEELLAPIVAVKRIHRLLTAKSGEQQPMVIVINYVDDIMDASRSTNDSLQAAALRIAIKEMAQDERIKEGKHLVVLLGRYAHELAPLLSRPTGVKIIRIGKPGNEERSTFAQHLGLPRQTASIFARAASGLALKDMQEVCDEVGAAADKERLLSACFTLKQAVIRDEFGDLIEIMRPELGFEVIGGLVKVVAELKRVAVCMREGHTNEVPQGIMLMGPPGTGKTLLAEAMARDAGVNVLKMLDVKSKWVGESEQRMTRLLTALRDFGPAIVFVDEFDQNQSSRDGHDGDSGVSRNLFKKMLEFMSDVSLRGFILWLFATNRPDLIDEAMKRPGRCDLRIPLLPPDEDRLVAICERSLLQFRDTKANIKDWRPFAKRCKGYGGAEMVEVVRRALVAAQRDKRDTITKADMEWACADYRPQSIDRRDIARMIVAAFNDCSSNELMPSNADEVMKECVAALRSAS